LIRLCSLSAFRKKATGNILKHKTKQQKKQNLSEAPGGVLLMEESMKKVILLTLIAMMLLSMLAMSACKPKPAEEPMVEEAPLEEAPVVEDTTAVQPEAETAPVTQ